MEGIVREDEAGTDFPESEEPVNTNGEQDAVQAEQTDNVGPQKDQDDVPQVPEPLFDPSQIEDDEEPQS